MQLAGGGLAKQPTALSGHIKGFVDSLLDVTAGFGEDLAHLAGHIAGKFFLVLDEDAACAKKNLSPLGRRNQPPGGECLLRSGHRQGYVLGMGGGKSSHHVCVVGRIQVQNGLTAYGGLPLAAD